VIFRVPSERAVAGRRRPWTADATCARTATSGISTPPHQAEGDSSRRRVSVGRVGVHGGERPGVGPVVQAPASGWKGLAAAHLAHDDAGPVGGGARSGAGSPIVHRAPCRTLSGGRLSKETRWRTGLSCSSCRVLDGEDALLVRDEGGRGNVEASVVFPEPVARRRRWTFSFGEDESPRSGGPSPLVSEPKPEAARSTVSRVLEELADGRWWCPLRATGREHHVDCGLPSGRARRSRRGRSFGERGGPRNWATFPRRAQEGPPR